MYLISSGWAARIIQRKSLREYSIDYHMDRNYPQFM